MTSTSISNTEVVDNKNIITDMAFGVDDKLLGKKLATPTQRGIAMAIDACLVLLLTDVGGVFWGLFAGIAVFRFGKKSEQKRWRFTRYLLRAVGAFAVFVSVVIFISDNFNDVNATLDKDDPNVPSFVKNNSESVSVNTFANSIKFGALVVSLATDLEDPNCDRACYHPKVQNILKTMVELEMPLDEVQEFISDNVNDLPLKSDVEKLEYSEELKTIYQGYVDKKRVAKKLVDKPVAQVAESRIEDTTNEVKTVAEEVSDNNDQTVDTEKTKATPSAVEGKQSKPVYSIVEFGKAIIADLGLGFGWAALYFTAFPAWWRGQTPGKRLMGIRVIQLDGTYMSAWDSFGRYGGYGAGFATGLLGFFQIYWDSNRQAIQDKISATVVIKGDLSPT